MPASLADVLALMAMASVVGLVLYGLVRLLLGNKPAPTQPRRQRGSIFRSPQMDASGWTLVVDGSNMAFRRDSRLGRDVARHEYLQEVVDVLQRQLVGANIIVFCDASLRHRFSGEGLAEFETSLKFSTTMYRQCPAGTSADRYILRYAKEHERCIVVSNDRFGNGDEVELRLNVPLLRVTMSRTSVKPSAWVYTHTVPSASAQPQCQMLRNLIKNG